jgi:hypothetical protein
MLSHHGIIHLLLPFIQNHKQRAAIASLSKQAGQAPRSMLCRHGCLSPYQRCEPHSRNGCEDKLHASSHLCRFKTWTRTRTMLIKTAGSSGLRPGSHQKVPAPRKGDSGRRRHGFACRIE